ncbi:MAG: hypothetical protein ACRBM6_13560 [Geminicoccales bacterium]
MTLADKIVGLQARLIEQVGRLLALHPNPHIVFVADFFGSREMNLLEGAGHLSSDTFIPIHKSDTDGLCML